MNINIDILDSLMPNLLTVFTQLAASLLLCFLMYKLGYKPVKKIMDDRSEFEQSNINKALKLKEENEAINNQKEELIADAKKKAEATLKGEKEKDKLIKQGKDKAKQILDEASSTLEAQINKMIKESKQEIVDMIIETSAKILDKEVKVDVNKDVDDFLRDLDNE